MFRRKFFFSLACAMAFVSIGTQQVAAQMMAINLFAFLNPVSILGFGIFEYEKLNGKRSIDCQVAGFDAVAGQRVAIYVTPPVVDRKDPNVPPAVKPGRKVPIKIGTMFINNGGTGRLKGRINIDLEENWIVSVRGRFNVLLVEGFLQ